jgi:3-mercaptopyruvate sulfurtransferase SseA
MRFIFSFLLIVMLAFAGISCQRITALTADKQNVAAEEAPRISLEDAKKDFDAGKAIFVDSRSAESYKQNHIKGALNIPFGDAEARWKEIPTDKKIIVYCS